MSSLADATFSIADATSQSELAGTLMLLREVLVQIGLPVKNYLIKRIPYRLNRTAFHMAGAAAYFRPSLARSNWPLRIRCVNSMPEIVIAALLNRLKPSIAFVLDLMWRRSCSITLFRYLDDRTFVPIEAARAEAVSGPIPGIVSRSCPGASVRWIQAMASLC